jgi:ribosome maturation factor RimP
MGASGARFHERGGLAGSTGVHEREKALTREIAQTVERGLPGVEVLAVELNGRERFTVYVDRPGGVDHALCERVTGLLRGYLDRYRIEVSSPGLERPLRKPGHFRNVVGRKVSLRTESEIGGRTRFRGEVLAAGERSLTVSAAGASVDIPYEAIVRANLKDEGYQ